MPQAAELSNRADRPPFANGELPGAEVSKPSCILWACKLKARYAVLAAVAGTYTMVNIQYPKRALEVWEWFISRGRDT